METTARQRRGIRDALAYMFRRGVFWFGFYIRPPIHWFIARFSKVGNPPVFDNDVFAWIPEFEDNWVRAMWSFQEVYAQPVPEVGHSQRIPPLHIQVIPNLYWACMHHVYPWDRGTNYAVELGMRVAQIIAQ